ncbi:MAG TPA: uracil-DNA glycosylase [Oscillatoriaceae cyanobacterium]
MQYFRHAMTIAAALWALWALSACAVVPLGVPAIGVNGDWDALGLQAAPESRLDLSSYLQDESWRQVIGQEFEKDYFLKLESFLAQERTAGHTYFPANNLIFNAFNQTPFDHVKVVILGQDPYPTPGNAMGLSFSVNDGVKVPASLANIYKELNSDLGLPIPTTGNLTPWARQGVLLLNTTLTVRAGAPGSHQKQGWETFTDTVIRDISAQRSGVVFLLWGKFAQSKASLIDTSKNHILMANHPSPLSASKGFFGSRPFSKTNALLQQEGQTPIDWRLP